MDNKLKLGNIGEMSTEQKRAALAKMLKSKSAVNSIFPLSNEQRSMWFQQSLNLANTAFNIPVVYVIHVDVDENAVTKSINDLVNRHDTLRTQIISNNGEPLQKIKEKLEVTIPVTALNLSKAADWKSEVLKYSAQQAKRPFDFKKGPLFRVELVQVYEGLSILMLTIHHIIFDGWSVGVFLREFAQCYLAYTGGNQPHFAALKRKYTDFVKEQRSELTEEQKQQQLEYWQRRLQGSPASLSLPTDFARDKLMTTKGTTYDLPVPESLAKRLESLGKFYGATFFMTMLTTFYVLLSRLSGQCDIVLGVATANRKHEDYWGLIGLFSNVMPMRAQFDGDATFITLLKQVTEQCFTDLENDGVSITSIIETVNPDRDPSMNVLFQAGFDFQNTPWPSAEVKQGVSLLNGDNGASKLDLNLTVTKIEKILLVTFEYNSGLFTKQTIESFASAYRQLLEHIVESPDVPVDRLPLLGNEQQAKIMKACEGPDIEDYADLTIAELVLKNTQQHAENLALTSAADSLTYREFGNRVFSLAAKLRQHGVKAQEKVGLFFDQSIEYVVSVFATWSVGASYVPLDRKLPDARIRFILSDSGIGTVLTRKELLPLWTEGDYSCASICADDLDEQLNCSPSDAETIRLSAPSPQDTAYTIYTSGTTGKPKGVVVSHAALSHYVQGAVQTFKLTAQDRLLQFASVSFDTCCEEIFPCLSRGATLVVRHEAMISTMEAFLAEVDALSLTAINLPTAYWGELVTALEENPTLIFPSKVTLVVIGGEAAPLPLVKMWLRRFGDSIRLLNTYGPTETTVSVTTADLSTLAGRVDSLNQVPIGWPNPASRVMVVDKKHQLVPLGVIGEIVVGGPTLSEGYWERGDLTQQHFVDDPFAKPGAKLYKTGDFGRLRLDLGLEYKGRMDGQIKFRGYRIETAEIESVLLQHEQVLKACVLLRSDLGVEQLVAYVAPKLSMQIGGNQLLSWIAQQCPAYMVPSQCVLIEQMPMNSSGKVDLPKLYALPLLSSDDDAISRPRNTTEEVLTGIWSALLERPDIDIHANFFRLGGHSLLITKMLSRIGKILKVELPLSSVFEAPTIASLSEFIDQQRLLAEDASVPPRIIKRPHSSERAPLSFSQRRFWFIDQLETGGTKYNMPVVFKLSGKFDIEGAQTALGRIIQRHEILRTVYRKISKPLPGTDAENVEQLILEDVDFAIDVVDISKESPEVQHDLVIQAMDKQWQHHFDLESQLAINAQVLILGRAEHILLINMHHIAVDGWSWEIIKREFEAEYYTLVRGESSPISAPSIQYADFALWQRAWFRSGGLARQMAYWVTQLADLPTVHSLPLDRPRQHIRQFAGAHHRVILDREKTAKFQSYAKENKLTVFMLVHAVFSLLIAKYSGERQVVMGTPVANRTQRELESLVGCFVNMLVLRVNIDPEIGITDYLQQVKALNVEALNNQDVPFELLVEKLNPHRSMQLSPLFQILINMDVASDAASEVLDGLHFSPLASPTTKAKFDLSLNIVAGETLSFDFEYLTEIFEQQTIIGFGQHLLALIDSMLDVGVGKLSELSMLSAAEQHTLTCELNPQDEICQSQATIHGLFEHQVLQRPDSLAAISASDSLTYRQLQERAEKVAFALIDRGLQVGDKVGVLLPRNSDLLVGLLAILKCGAAYVPLHRDFSRQRIELILDDCQIPFLLTSPQIEGVEWIGELKTAWTIDALLLAEPFERTLPSSISPDALAYLIYTSGSTGKPKAVAITHSNAASMIEWAGDTFSSAELACVLASTQLTFDLSVFELFVPISHGGAVRIVENALVLLEQPWEDITLINTVPSVGRALLNGHGIPPKVSTVNLAGEPLPPKLLIDLLALGTVERVYNLYGPSEDTTYSTYTSFVHAVEQRVPIGKPIKNSRAYVVDIFNQLAPIGAAGELLLAGAGVAQGYFNRPELSNEKFVHWEIGQLPAQRLYRTGDRVQWNNDGQLEYLGRLDDQIKFNGFRIEVGEIRYHIEQLDWVDTVVVQKVRLRGKSSAEDTESDRFVLSAYVKVIDLEARDQVQLLAALRQHLSMQLPSYMLPNTFSFLSEFPLTANGKIDRKALPVPTFDQKSDGVAPSTPPERFIAGIWREVLGEDCVFGVTDDFFALGGHSLLAVSVIANLMDKLQLEIPLAAFFTNPTIRGLSQALAVHAGGEARLIVMVETYDHITSLSESEVKQLIKEHEHSVSHCMLEEGADR